MALSSKAKPSARAWLAGILVSKKIHKCAPLPEREISIAWGISNAWHALDIALTSSCQQPLSKSAANK